MTFRAVILGFLGAAAISGFNYLNDQIMVLTPLIGNNMPISVYGALICFVVFCNPVLVWIGRRHALAGRELALAMAITLGACCIPHAGLLQPFTGSLIMPYHIERTMPGWQEQKVLELPPKQMMPDISQDEEHVLGGFLQGMAVGKNHISLSDIPWKGWERTLRFWLPVILSLWIGLIGLSLVVHRQWSHHEHLPYPVATFAAALLPEEGRTRSLVLSNRLFWLGAVPVFLIYLDKYAFVWWPHYLFDVKTKFDFSAIGNLFPVFVKGGGPGLLGPYYCNIYLTVVGFAFFLPKDVSLGLGVGPYLWALLVGGFATYGISLTQIYAGNIYIGLNPQAFMLAGAYMGIFLVLAYTGRRYYLSVFRRALFFRTRDDVGGDSVWGARIFLAMLTTFVIQLALVGLDWQIALLYSGLTVMIFVVISRILAETGIFFVQPYFFPCAVVWGVFGSEALGPQTLMILFLVSMVLLIDPRETVMAFTVNSLKLLEMRHVHLGRATGFLVLSLFVGLAIALPVTLYYQYDRGYHVDWSTTSVPRMPFDNVVQVQQRLEAVGALETAGTQTGWARFGAASPHKACMASLAAGMGFVLLFTVGRLRWSKWPLHPVLFLVWSTYPGQHFCWSFLVGWLVKVLVGKYGGSMAYNKLKPLMIGLIAGEVLGSLVPSIVGAIYYFATGDPPKQYFVLPR